VPRERHARFAVERELSVAKANALRVTDVGGGGARSCSCPACSAPRSAFRKLLPAAGRAGYRVVVIEPLGIAARAQARRPPTTRSPRRPIASTAVARRSAIDQAWSWRTRWRGRWRSAWRRVIRARQAIVSLDGGPAEAAATPGFRRAMSFAFLIKLFGGMRGSRSMVRSALRERSADRPGSRRGRPGLHGPRARAISTGRSPLSAGWPGASRSRSAPRSPKVRCPVRLLIGTATRVGGIREPELGC
jgi:hypothetical protein